MRRPVLGIWTLQCEEYQLDPVGGDGRAGDQGLAGELLLQMIPPMKCGVVWAWMGPKPKLYKSSCSCCVVLYHAAHVYHDFSFSSDFSFSFSSCFSFRFDISFSFNLINASIMVEHNIISARLMSVFLHLYLWVYKSSFTFSYTRGCRVH
jgi:hypothetical protein